MLSIQSLVGHTGRDTGGLLLLHHSKPTAEQTPETPQNARAAGAPADAELSGAAVNVRSIMAVRSDSTTSAESGWLLTMTEELPDSAAVAAATATLMLGAS